MEIGNLILDPQVVASIIGLVAIIKQWLPHKYLILLTSLVLGILFASGSYSYWLDIIIYGIAYGLSASVTWSGAKAVVNSATSK